MIAWRRFSTNGYRKPTRNLTLSWHRQSPALPRGLEFEQPKSRSKARRNFFTAPGVVMVNTTTFASLMGLPRLFRYPLTSLAVNNLKSCWPFGYHRAGVAIKSKKMGKRGWHRRSLAGAFQMTHLANELVLVNA